MDTLVTLVTPCTMDTIATMDTFGPYGVLDSIYGAGKDTLKLLSKTWLLLRNSVVLGVKVSIVAMVSIPPTLQEKSP